MEEFPPNNAEKERFLAESKKLFERDLDIKVHNLCSVFIPEERKTELKEYLEHLDPRLEKYSGVIGELATTGINLQLLDEDWPEELYMAVEDMTSSAFREEESKLIRKGGRNKWLLKSLLAETRAKLLLHQHYSHKESVDFIEDYFKDAFLVLLYEYGVDLPEKYNFYFKDRVLPSKGEVSRVMDQVFKTSSEYRVMKRQASLEKDGLDPRIAKRRAEQDAKMDMDDEAQRWERHEGEIRNELELLFDEFPDPSEFLFLMLNLDDGELPAALTGKR
jgi:hypothetical protein